MAGGAYAVNGSVGVADGAIRINQGDIFNGAMEMSLSLFEAGSGFKLLSDTTPLGKYVDEFIRDNRGCVGARKAVETSYGKSTLNSLKNTENFTDSAIEHIFEGNIRRGTAGGYH